MTETVYVIGWPRSGTTWLTWLLGDALNSATGAKTPGLDHKDWVTNRDRNGLYIVRRTHVYHVIGEARAVMIVRDPRGVVASAMQYWDRCFDKQLVKMRVSKIGTWAQHVAAGLDAGLPFVRYEDLLLDCEGALTKLLDAARLQYDPMRIGGVVERQSFEIKSQSRKRETGGRVIPERFFWKACAETWKSALTAEQAAFVWEEFGTVAKRAGYQE